MRITKFVSKKNIPLTKSDVNLFKNAILDMIGPVASLKLKSVTNNTKEIINPKYPNAEYAQNLVVHAEYVITSETGEPIIGRNLDNERVYFRSLTIVVNKEIDDNNKTQFSWNMYFDGYMFAQGSSLKDKMYIPGAYQYGTEVSDFNIPELSRTLNSLLTLQHSSKSQMQKIIQAFNK